MNKIFSTDHLKTLWLAFKLNVPTKLSELLNDMKLSSFENDMKLSSFENDLEVANPDWDQIDETQPDYVKNRPMGLLTPEYYATRYNGDPTVSTSAQSTYYHTNIDSIAMPQNLNPQSTYKVIFDGVEYNDVPCRLGTNVYGAGLYPQIGETMENMKSQFPNGKYVEYPFLLFDNGATNKTFMVTKRDYVSDSDIHKTYHLEIYEYVAPEIKRLDKKYLPEELLNEVDELTNQTNGLINQNVLINVSTYRYENTSDGIIYRYVVDSDVFNTISTALTNGDYMHIQTFDDDGRYMTLSVSTETTICIQCYYNADTKLIVYLCETEEQCDELYNG